MTPFCGVMSNSCISAMNNSEHSRRLRFVFMKFVCKMGKLQLVSAGDKTSDWVRSDSGGDKTFR